MCTRGTFLKLLYFRGPKGILEIKIGRFNKTAPAHKAQKTQDWCKANFPDMISSEERPPYTPDLNPMDYSVRSILESRACSKSHKTLDSLKQSLLRE
ncbi:uncharacterized protein TNCV_2469301 [Trichonephila clavipes]|nr:uncharacterized protein TNCV_2469301 [Trichonephila clavipes]